MTHSISSKYSINYVYFVLNILLLNILLLSAENPRKNLKSPFKSHFVNAASKSRLGPACLTDGCKQAALYLRSSIDSSVDPCDNFYNFACGGFVERSKISKALLNAHSRLGDVQDTVTTNIKETLEEKVDPNEPRIFQLAKNFYKACMDVATIERYGLQPLRDIIDKLGGWPVVVGDTWNMNKFSWTHTDIIARKMGFYPKSIFEIFVFCDFFNSSRTLLHIKPPTPYISSANLKRGWNNTVVKAYHQYMLQVAVLLGADKERAAREMKDALDFEAELSLAAKNPSKTMKHLNVFQIQYSLRELIDLYGDFHWGRYLGGLTKPIVHLKFKDRVIIRSPYYTSNLKKLMRKTPKRVIANYMIWRIIADVIPHLSSNIREIEFNFKKQITGKMRRPERSDVCVDLINDKKGLVTAVSAFYVRKYFTNETRTAIIPILHSIINEATKVIQEADWVDQKSKKAALRKIAFMKEVIAFPDELISDQVLDDYSQTLELYPYGHLHNILNLNKFHYDYSLQGLNKSTNSTLWVYLSDSTGVNAYYYSLKNIFVILAGILQVPLFIPNWPFYAKYGSIGFIIGHEMMHAFDTTNILFDETGSVHPLFDSKTQEKYNKKVACFVGQYNSFVDDKLGLHVDGNLTINENLADNMGIKISYRAYKTWQANHKQELRLPTLKYTPEQIFWIASIGFLCGRMSTKQRLNLLLTEVHTPDTFRTRGTLSNLPDFAQAFNCKPGTRMNPIDKCSMW